MIEGGLPPRRLDVARRQAFLHDRLADLPDADVARLAYANAAELFRWPLPLEPQPPLSPSA